jgi:hypothetical protein
MILPRRAAIDPKTDFPIQQISAEARERAAALSPARAFPVLIESEPGSRFLF